MWLRKSVILPICACFPDFLILILEEDCKIFPEEKLHSCESARHFHADLQKKIVSLNNLTLLLLYWPHPFQECHLFASR